MRKKELEQALDNAFLNNRRLNCENKKMKRAINEFIDRCEDGSIRSVKTYLKFKRIIDSL